MQIKIRGAVYINPTPGKPFSQQYRKRCKLKTDYNSTIKKINKMEKTLFKPIGLAIFSIMLLMLSCSNAGDQKDEKKSIPEKPTNEEIIKKGQQLVTIMGCNDCHSPKKNGAHGPGNYWRSYAFRLSIQPANCKV